LIAVVCSVDVKPAMLMASPPNALNGLGTKSSDSLGSRASFRNC
jgi:hypothetical protein